ncbi:hypothetical protein M378DRAFT_643224 [Amanita muscaria Koide BX008]|uniref:Uncharacterized protein n=1 Tax=Amanita muscaria (strain Koide BX008) TaxID=946122 RepID=A0A0C2WQW2_AMAMK|nr:hypothetical protein M378DRAFT_643224 [Amanita muscaria Koide BX008]
MPSPTHSITVFIAHRGLMSPVFLCRPHTFPTDLLLPHQVDVSDISLLSAHVPNRPSITGIFFMFPFTYVAFSFENCRKYIYTIFFFIVHVQLCTTTMQGCMSIGVQKMITLQEIETGWVGTIGRHDANNDMCAGL